ncbi:hypothetical protein M1L60_24860 [Actinoplanes sp. TRM 88003]|uniref:DNA mismatch repair proteins mutS family domain-containing protein n=1 Tax=Paractinoplanes aksuensis TaxID=2939490 RepID=A0ABT1DSM7_9ACTN|nr:hypothetical protein [Actinoplanes aksuensis]MCO8273832.1 hypothetical protein [Actinoplanes aksuensis]
MSDSGLFAPPARTAPEPDYFADLQLDQLVDAVVAGRERPDLVPAFRVRLTDGPTIRQRQEVVADLADPRLRAALRTFCDDRARCTRQFERADRTRHRPRARRTRLAAVVSYVQVINDVTDALANAAPASTGLRDWLTWLEAYRAGPDFAELAREATALRAELDEIHYTLAISGAEVTAAPFAGQDDLSAAVRATFDRFRADDVEPYRFELRAGIEMEQMDDAVLDLVVQLAPDVFDRVGRFLDAHPTVEPAVIAEVERELQFVLAWLDFIAPLQAAGLPFTRPELGQDGRLEALGTFDVLLAHSLVAAGQQPATNDAVLGDGERMLVITGPNQGGKTTFARTVGQLYHLAALGLPVPGRAVTLHAPDAILTHFERGDRAGDLTSRLEDEVERVAGLLTRVGPRSVVVLNEMFSSTTWVDARTMNTDVLRAVLDADATAVCVTFIDELSRLDPRIVSLVADRDFRVVRARADGEAHAVALAARYGLTRGQLRTRIEAHA